METAYDSFATSKVFPLGLTYLGNPPLSDNSDCDRKNIEALLGVLEDDLLNGGRFFNQLRKYAIQITRDFQLAEDAVADFYCNIVRRLEGELEYKFKYQIDREKGIDRNPEIIPWARACIDNSSRDINRKRNSGINRKIHRDGNKLLEVKIGLIEEPENEAYQEELKGIVHQHIGWLSEPHQEVIRLCYLEGLRYREAAEVLGIPLGTVKSRMDGALKQLRRDLSHYNSN